MYDGEGRPRWSLELDIYGGVHELKEDDSTLHLRYPGQYFDEETGLSYNRFRYYDAAESVYLSVDPIGLAGGNPTLYGYVGDVNGSFDPFGLQSCDLEDTVKDRLTKENIPFKHSEQFGKNGSIGEIDFEVDRAIIEVTKVKSGKLNQVNKLINNTTMNPQSKPVILFAPNYRRTPAKDIESAGAVVVRDLDDLVGIVK